MHRSTFAGSETGAGGMARDAVLVAASTYAGIGLAAVVLCVLLLVDVISGSKNVNSMNLILVARLVFGMALFLAGAAMSGGMVSMMRRK